MQRGLLSNHTALLGSLRSTFDTIIKCCAREQLRLAGTPQAAGFVGIEGCALEGIRWIDFALKLRSAKLQQPTDVQQLKAEIAVVADRLDRAWSHEVIMVLKQSVIELQKLSAI